MTRRSPLVWTTAAVVVIVVLGVAAYVFQPWRLFTNTTVDDALPPAVGTSTASPGPTTRPTPEAVVPTPADPEPSFVDLSSGSFITHEHDTTGSARIVQQPDGSRVLAIEGLMTSDGPDLRVWLTDQPVVAGFDGWHVFDDGRYVELGALKGNLGDQVYEIPSDVDLGGLQSVSIWCARFAVSFGAAALEPA